ncbi:MAG: bifunctional UDP-sugar hydrolase/5'-nucleotidase [Atopococcus tabaci]|uniref:Bifunctional UDP-sugar hydrolase/5'-nucleotidase n=1 Tax=Atopococcus tabaci TaxID=269774 RepID=A0AA43UC69_9LACT|nr:bifunctional UDP-sugar hydrolase/5'-nucleotidase [Atopococcus tabaci]
MKVTILSTSDIHGHFTSENYKNPGETLSAGLSRAASVIEEERSRALNPVIYIDNGDLTQGSPLAKLYSDHDAPRKLMKGINTLRPDAGTLGNHEFNFGRDYLEKSMYSASHLTVLGNVLINGKPAFGPAYMTKTFGAVKVGILGLTSPVVKQWENPDHIKGMQFIPALEAAERWIPLLKEQEKCDVVVVAYHGGFEKNPRTGEEIEGLPGENEAYALLKSDLPIDVLITGHQHKVCAEIIDGRAVLQSGIYGEAVGKIVLEFERGEDNQIQSEVISCENIMTNDYPEAKDIKEIYEEDIRNLQEYLSREVGQVSDDFVVEDVYQAQVEGHAYIDLINDIQLEAMEADISATSFFNDQVKGLPSTVTQRDLYYQYPFPAILSKVLITGRQLKELLEENATYFTADEDGGVQVAEKYTSVKDFVSFYDLYRGIDYEYDFSQPEGNRLVRLEKSNQVILDDDELELVVNSYGNYVGKHYPEYFEDKLAARKSFEMADLMSHYIQKHGPLV